MAVLLLGGGVWLIHSPWMSVSQVEVEGVDNSDANRTLVDAGVVAGMPMFKIDGNSVEQALETDPWIADASVVKRWPDRVEVGVVERVPVAWANTAGGWTRRSLDGAAIPSDGDPDPEMVHIDLATVPELEAESSLLVLGALEFATALEPDLQAGTVITLHDSELWATVSGFQVRLGRPIEMREKAVTLGALLAEDPVSGSVLTLIAPTNPAVMTPRGVAVDKSKSDTDGQAGEQGEPEDEGESGG